MTIREIKREAKIIAKENTKQRSFAYWYLYVGPAIISIGIISILNSVVQSQGYSVNMEFLIPLIMGFFSIWYAKFAVNIIRGKGDIKESKPVMNHFWEYFPYIALLSVLLLLNLVLPLWVNFYINIIVFILQYVFLPIPFVIAILNREGAGRIGFKLGAKYFFRTIMLEIRFIPLYFLIAITFGILGFWKYTYIQTTYALYTLDIMNKTNVK